MKWLNKIVNVLLLFLPLYGAGVRFRIYLRMREFFRVHEMYFLASCLKSYLHKRYGCELSINAKISPNVSFMHTTGVIVGEGVTISGGVKIYGNITLGRKDVTNESDYPMICEGVVLSTGCVVLGKVFVRQNTIVGAHAVVLSDTEANTTYVGCPAKKMERKRY